MNLLVIIFCFLFLKFFIYEIKWNEILVFGFEFNSIEWLGFLLYFVFRLMMGFKYELFVCKFFILVVDNDFIYELRLFVEFLVFLIFWFIVNGFIWVFIFFNN